MIIQSCLVTAVPWKKSIAASQPNYISQVTSKFAEILRLAGYQTTQYLLPSWAPNWSNTSSAYHLIQQSRSILDKVLLNSLSFQVTVWNISGRQRVDIRSDSRSLHVSAVTLCLVYGNLVAEPKVSGSKRGHHLVSNVRLDSSSSRLHHVRKIRSSGWIRSRVM